jgi:hypothetical protein
LRSTRVEHGLRTEARPHALRGIVQLPERAQAVVVVTSSARLDSHALVANVANDLFEAGLGVALFDDLLSQTPRQSDPLTVFDTQILASRIGVVTDLLERDPRFRDFRFGLLGLGGAGAAAIISATERPRFADALVLYDAPLVAASDHLPVLASPSLLVLPATKEEDSGFLVSRPPAAVRELMVLPGRAALGAARLKAIAAEAGRWFLRHLAPAR